MNVFDKHISELQIRLVALKSVEINLEELKGDKVSDKTLLKLTRYSELYDFVVNFAEQNHRKPALKELPSLIKQYMSAGGSGVTYTKFLEETRLINIPGYVKSSTRIDRHDIDAIREKVRVYQQNNDGPLIYFIYTLAGEYKVSISRITVIVYEK